VDYHGGDAVRTVTLVIGVIRSTERGIVVTRKFAAECVSTFILVFFAVGSAVFGFELVGIPLDGTSVNPTRSLGPVPFQGGTALTHVSLVAPAPEDQPASESITSTPERELMEI
jgi:hypothetical protein